MKAEIAWQIPYKIYKILGTFEINDLGKITLNEYIEIFENNKLHRFNKVLAKVVYEMLKFNGCGLKIATMTANILARQFKIEFSDYYSIDISTDVHINRVMRRMGVVPKNADNTMIIYKAREPNPEFPGIIDFSC